MLSADRASSRSARSRRRVSSIGPRGRSSSRSRRVVARVTTWSTPASSSTSPIASARSESTIIPGTSIASAWRRPMVRCISRMIPGGIAIPTWVSFRPIVNGPSAITRQSQHSASTQPPAGAWPAIAAATGTGQAASARAALKKLFHASYRAFASSWIDSSRGTSSPAENTFGPPERTRPSAPASTAAAIESRSAAHSAGLIALTGGRARRSSWMRPCRTLWISSLMRNPCWGIAAL